MKNISSKVKLTRLILLMSIIVTPIMFNSCVDNFLENNKPSWLGESIYDQLEQGYKDENGVEHTFKTYIRLIDDNEYTEVLKKTGSKTLFVSDDAAFERFYQSNNWGVKSYEGFSLSQKKLILNSSMINNAYLIELMSGTEGPVKGQAFRRATAYSPLDSICVETAATMPLNTNWDYYRNKGSMYLIKDGTEIPMLHFLQEQMDFKGITNSDLSFILNETPRVKDDAFIFGNKVVVRDITCKNGYINILQDVLTPPANMAEIIRTAPDTKLFSSILERFAAPYYSSGLTSAYKLYREKEIQKGRNLPEIDSLFTKNYFAERSSGGISKIANPKGKLQAGYLEFDPGWNTYSMSNSQSSSFQTDMATMFVPSDEVLSTFFNDGGGKFLIEKYKSIENIPNEVLAELLRNHMKPSFLGSLPGKFPEILDDAKRLMGVEKGHVTKTYLANNGVVYVTNQIYAPASYVAVTAPMLVNDNMKIFRWAVKTLGYSAYLLSMDSRYSFIVPWDQTTPENSVMGEGMYYLDPVSLGKEKPEIFRFWYNSKLTTVSATAYLYNKETGEIGDSIRSVPTVEVLDRLDDILDNQIVVGDIENGQTFFHTKGGGEIKVNGSGVGMKIMGGGNIEKSALPVVDKIYDQTTGGGNGKVYVTNSLLDSPYKSVYKILSETEEFREFFLLLQGSEILYKDESSVGLDYNIKVFNTYHYSVYVPNNAAVLDAISQGLPTWDIINAQTDQEIKTQLTLKLTNFLRYHFQDNSLYINNVKTGITPYETAAYSLTGKKGFYKLYSQLDNTSLTLYNCDLTDPLHPTFDKSNPIHVKTDNGRYNIMSREFKFNSGDIANATQIETSSYAVIHEIDQVLLYSKDELKSIKQLLKSSPNYSRKVIKTRSVK